MVILKVKEPTICYVNILGKCARTASISHIGKTILFLSNLATTEILKSLLKFSQRDKKTRKLLKLLLQKHGVMFKSQRHLGHARVKNLSILRFSKHVIHSIKRVITAKILRKIKSAGFSLISWMYKKRDHQCVKNADRFLFFQCSAKYLKDSVKTLCLNSLNNNLISSNQSGFKPRDSCINQLIAITHVFEGFNDGLEIKRFSCYI